MANVFIEHEDEKNPRLTNSTGADLAQFDFAVINGLPLIANDAIANGEVGSFHLNDGSIMQIDADTDGETGENTFGTANADVFWTPSGTFSDTSTVGYVKIGTVSEIKDSDNIVRVRISVNTETV